MPGTLPNEDGSDQQRQAPTKNGSATQNGSKVHIVSSSVPEPPTTKNLKNHASEEGKHASGWETSEHRYNAKGNKTNEQT